MTTFNYCKVRKVKSPVRGTSVAAGIDFFIPEDISDVDWSEKCKVTKRHPITMFNDDHILTTIILAPGDSVMIPSGIKMKLPDGYEAYSSFTLAEKKHTTTKAETSLIESTNFLIRHYLARFQRSSIRFSKSLEYVYYSLLLLFTKKKRLLNQKI